MFEFLKDWFTYLWFLLLYVLMTLNLISLRFFYNNSLSDYLIWGKLTSSANHLINKVGNPRKDDCPEDNDSKWSKYIQTIPCPFIYEGRMFPGAWTNPILLDELQNNFIFKDDDILVMSSPKSGTTWVQLIVQLIMNKEISGETTIDESFPRIEHSGWISNILGPDKIKSIESLKSPRLLSTHLTTKFLQRALSKSKCKLIYVVRNPKDAMVSAYYFHKMSKFSGKNDDWSIFFDFFLKGKLMMFDWFEHIKEAVQWEKKNNDRMLTVAYEELIVDLTTNVKLIASFLNHSLSDGSIENIVKECSFSMMHSNKFVNREKEDCNDYKFAFDFSELKFMRKGVIGDHVNLFTLNQDARFNHFFAKKMSGMEIRFAYSEEEAKNNIQMNDKMIVG